MGNRRTLQTSVVAAVSAVSRGGVVAAVIVVAIVGLVLRLLLCLLVSLLLSLFLSLLGGICLLLGLHRGGDVGLGLLQFRNRIIDVGFGRTGPVITVLASVMAFCSAVRVFSSATLPAELSSVPCACEIAELRFDFSVLVSAVAFEVLTALIALLMASVLSAMSLASFCSSLV